MGRSFFAERSDEVTEQNASAGADGEKRHDLHRANVLRSTEARVVPDAEQQEDGWNKETSVTLASIHGEM